MQQINIYLTECSRLLVFSRSVMFLLLMIMTWKDIQKHKISVSMLVFCGTISAISSGIVTITGSSAVWKSYLAGLGIGLIFIGISKVTRESLGYGDGLLMCILGGYLGIWGILELLVATWTLTAIAAGIMLMRNQFRKRTVLPMVPLITFGYATVWFTEIMTVTNA